MRRTALYIFVAALLARLAIAAFRSAHGIALSWPNLEGIDDFNGIYVQQLSQMAKGFTPYRDFAVSYPPLFLYSLFPFYLLGGSAFASVPILFADAATAVVVYLVVMRHSNERVGAIAGFAYATSPFALYYEGYIWFSSQPMTLFIALAVLYLFAGKRVLSMSMLGIAIMFKQEAVFLLPVFLLQLYHGDRGTIVKSLLTLLAIVGLVSLPFLWISPKSYLSLVSYGLFGRWSGKIQLAQVATAACQNLYSNSLGTARLCSLGTLSNLQFVSNASPATLLIGRVGYVLNVISSIVLVPIVLLTIPVLFSLRKHARFNNLLLAYSGAVFLLLFSLLFHPVFKYYYLPVFLLLFTCFADSRGVALAAGVAAIDLLAPSGAFQQLFVLLAILVACTYLDAESKRWGEISTRQSTWNPTEFSDG